MRRRISIVLSMVLGFAAILAFQNCGTQTNGSMFDSLDTHPLPYEAHVDQLAYMSCSEQKDIPNEDGVFFTFRTGAHGIDSGLKITDDFLFSTRFQSQFDRMETLANDGVTAMTRIQFSFRQKSALQRMFMNADSGDGTEEIDYDYIFGDLGTDEMSASLLSLPVGNYMNYWAAGGIMRDAYFQGTMVFNSSEILAEQVRDSLHGGGWVLALGYADAAEPATIRTPADYYTGDLDEGEEAPTFTSNMALGEGLDVRFKQASALTFGASTNTHLSNPKRVLSSVSNYDLSVSNGAGSRWNCPSTLQLMIVHPDDAADAVPSGTRCPVAEDGTMTDELRIVRNSLPATDWYVNLSKKCAVPRRSTLGSCYGINAGNNARREVQYDFNAECDPALDTATLNVCPHFISICYKP